jgi:hypothetical protein
MSAAVDRYSATKVPKRGKPLIRQEKSAGALYFKPARVRSEHPSYGTMDDSQLDPARNPYAPPHVADPALAPRVKPRTVVWATVALSVSAGLFFASAVRSLPVASPPKGLPTVVIINAFVVVISSLLPFVPLIIALIYFVSAGRNWARLIYAMLCCVHTVSLILHARLSVVFVSALMCEYMAMYWLFTEPGRRWFER